MSDFDDVLGEIDEGMAGRNAGLPMGFDRLNREVSLRKSNNYLIGGFTGTGKTSFVDDAFVLNPADYLMTHMDDPNTPKFEVVYWSMERGKKFKIIKWVARKIFMDQGIIVPVAKWMGWIPGEKITQSERDLFNSYRPYIDRLLTFIHIKDDSKEHNPTGMSKFMVDEFFAERGRIELIPIPGTTKTRRTYIPNDPTKIVLIVLDHLGLIRKQKGLATQKEIIDRCSEDQRYWRDFYGSSSVDLSQFNRSIANPARLKAQDVEPMLEDFKDSGSTQEDADVVMSLFDPFRYKVPDPSGYDLENLVYDGKKKYRNLRILKNTYGSDDIRIGLAFQPEIGMFKEMPRRAIITPEQYDAVKDNTYFLPPRRTLSGSTVNTQSVHHL